MKKGKGYDTLFEEIDKTCSRKRILESSYSNIEVRKVGEDIHWSMLERTSQNPNGKVYKGKGSAKLRARLDALYKTDTLSIMPDVLCLVEVTKNKVKYVLCDNQEKQDLEKGLMKLPIIEVEATQYELGKCCETRLALYDGKNIYPITKLASVSIGKLMDAIASFKNMAAIPIGSAFLLMEKLYELRKLDILYEDSKSEIKPLLSVCSDRYHQVIQKDFFNRMFELIGQEGLFYDEKEISWQIEDGVTTVDVPLSGFTVYNLNYLPVLRISSSELPGSSNQVQLLGKVGEGYILIRSNSHYSNHLQVDDLLDGVKDDIVSFNEKVTKRVNPNEKELKKLKEIVGKKRISDMKLGEETTIECFIKETFRVLPKKQAGLLMQFYADILKDAG